MGGIERAAGTTVVFSAEGVPRYVIPKPKPSESLPREINNAAVASWKATKDFVEESDARDPDAAWADPSWWGRRMEIRFGFAGLHRGVGRPF